MKKPVFGAEIFYECIEMLAKIHACEDLSSNWEELDNDCFCKSAPFNFLFFF